MFHVLQKNELNTILEKHKLWLSDSSLGERANLVGTNLRGADLYKADLSGANLCNADLRGANLRGAYFSNADICAANLRDAYLCNADLNGANLRGANLCNADLNGANLRGAYLYNADLNGADLSGAYLCNADIREAYINYPIACPEKGSFIGYKKANGLIVELQILDTAMRCSATSRKCRCSEAKVISITTLGGDSTDITEVCSSYDNNFIYKVGKIVKVENFDTNRWNECSSGIHFFITRDEAVNY